VPETLAPEDVRTVLAAAADVVFSDGVSPAFLEQWAEETCFLLGAHDDGPVDVRRRQGSKSTKL
jgi:hypothetical protein